MRVKLGSIAALMLFGSVLVTTPQAMAAPPEEHCSARVVGQRPNGELVLSPMVCRSSQDEAQLSAGAMTSAGSTTQASFTLGIHYDGFGFTGSSFSVVGDDCNGGWLNLSSTWDNRVSSTANGCPRTRHYDGDNLTGSSETLLGGGGNLSVLNNKANSIQYLS